MIPATSTTVVSTKGQVILPKAVRDLLHWDAGTRLAVEHMAEGVLLTPIAAAFAPTLAADVFGCLSYKGKAKSIEQMDAAVAKEARRRHARG
jgi:AbrB family looped-hinge helix DNA binding protein